MEDLFNNPQKYITIAKRTTLEIYRDLKKIKVDVGRLCDFFVVAFFVHLYCVRCENKNMLSFKNLPELLILPVMQQFMYLVFT